ncbi:hypothetical protein TNCV_4291931 [Trichonephila clavipes]|uniref:Uncharacterized protein n=1 Tax=Trichonephila clavipes TaxID=2585209 RepID=A0A8X6RFQ2_TRICX|nr:hypothetical protein TNCV_4291931 [Trichonephila clavipes]
MNFQHGTKRARYRLKESSISVRAVAAIGESRSSVHRVLPRQGKPQHSYNHQRVPSQIVIQISKHPAVRSISLLVLT